MAPRSPRKSAARRPKIPRPAFDPIALRWALVQLLCVAAAWDREPQAFDEVGVGRGREPEAADPARAERVRSREEDETFLRGIFDDVFQHQGGALLALSGNQQVIPFDLRLVPIRKAAADLLRRYRAGSIGEDQLVAELCETLRDGDEVTPDRMRLAISIGEWRDDSKGRLDVVRNVERWIKARDGAESAASALISTFFHRAGRFTYAAERLVQGEALGAGGLLLRSRGAVVTPRGTVAYLLRCLGYSAEKIEAVRTALHGPKAPGSRGGPGTTPVHATHRAATSRARRK
jgi:hypothetical protein